jgi:transposase InsO family protein
VKAGSQLAVTRMCALTGLSRAGFYRAAPAPRGEEVKLRDQVQRIALEWPTYGSRRITAELRRSGCGVNRKRVQRLMREDNLLCLRKRRQLLKGCRRLPLCNQAARFRQLRQEHLKSGSSGSTTWPHC